MNKRHVLLLTAVLGMASAFAQAQTTITQAATTQAATTQTATTPVKAVTAIRDPQLSTAPVSVNTGVYRGPLSVLLSALAKSAGYDLIFNFNVDAMALIDGNVISTVTNAPAATPGQAAPALPSYASATGKPAELSAKPIAYNFEKRPFNEVWPLLMDIYELQYDVVNLGSGQVIRISQRPALGVVKLKNLQADEVVRRLQQFYGTEILDKDSRPTGKYVFDSGTMKAVVGSSAAEVVMGGTAEEIKKMVEFVTKMDGEARGGVPSQQIYNVKGVQADMVALIAAQYPAIKITPVGQTGQLVLSGTKDQLDTAIALLNQVDRATQAKDATVQKVFQLVNASAEELKATLEGTLARDIASKTDLANATLLDPVTGVPYSGTLANAPMNQQNQQTTTSTAAGTTTTTAATPTSQATTPPVTIIADKRTNTLVVRGTQTQVNQVAELIPQLDKVVPQINVQVRIQEVTEKATRTLGLDWKVNFGGFQVKVGSGGLGATFDPTRTLVGFNIFPTLNALETQSLAKKVYDGSITMQSGQRALGNNSATQNSSSTAAASVKSGGRLDVNIPSAAANVPAIQKQIDYGVNLDFFDPQVAPDGTITLRVRGQVNDILTSIPENGVGVPNILKFSNSEAQSIITFKSGETVLLSGLMGSNNKDNTQGVPFLSSIPGVGAAFGNQSYEKNATQLLVVITGTVVQ